jgi:hypothetical protein
LLYQMPTKITPISPVQLRENGRKQGLTWYFLTISFRREHLRVRCFWEWGELPPAASQLKFSLLSEDVQNMHKRNVVLLAMLLGCLSVAQADSTTTLQGVNSPTLTLSTLNWGDITLNIGGQYTGTVNGGVLSLTQTTGGSLSDALFSISFSQPVGSLGIRGLSLYGSPVPAPVPLPVLDTPVPDAILPIIEGPIVGGDTPVIGEDVPTPIESPAPVVPVAEDNTALLEIPELIIPVIEASPEPIIETILASDPVPTDAPAAVLDAPAILEPSPDPIILEDAALLGGQNGQHGQGGNHDPNCLPEPTTLVYMGLTGVVAAIVRRRKK